LADEALRITEQQQNQGLIGTAGGCGGQTITLARRPMQASVRWHRQPAFIGIMPHGVLARTKIAQCWTDPVGGALPEPQSVSALSAQPSHPRQPQPAELPLRVGGKKLR
jgi:hypothetical protein